MSTPVATDTYLVTRGDDSFHVTQENIMATLQDTDLLLVNRSGDSYKITGADFKASIVTPLDPVPDDISSVPPFQGGTGTQADPFVLAPSTCMPAGSNVSSTELITITVAGAQQGQPVTWINNSNGSGSRFNQPGGVVDAGGLWTGRLVYEDIPDTTVDQTYGGSLQIGTAYFTWDVDQVVSSVTPPVINNVSLVESNPGVSPRFTDQSFVLSTSIDNGTPNSTKTIDAFTDGTITEVGNFSAALESSTPGSQQYADELVTITPGGDVAPAANPSSAFDGDLGTSATSQAGSHELQWTIPSSLYDTGDNWEIKVEASATYNVTKFKANGTSEGPDQYISDSNGWISFAVSTMAILQLDNANTGVFAQLFAVRLNGQLVVDTAGTLTFPTATNMDYLAAGDAVNGAGANYADSGLGGASQVQALQDNVFTPTYTDDYVSITSTTVAAQDGNNITMGQWQCTTGFITIKVDPTPHSGGSQQYYIWTENLFGTQINTNKLADPGDTLISMPLQNGIYNGIWVSNGSLDVLLKAVSTDDGTSWLYEVSSGSGTVASIDGPVVSLSSSTGTWINGNYVTGPTKTIPIENTRKYLEFNQSGAVSDLLDAPQDPPYTTTDTNPGLTFTFPATFPSGQTPDQELGEGTTITASVVADNGMSVGPTDSNIIQPEGGAAGPNLTGLTKLYTGAAVPNAQVTGVDLPTTGGMIWVKDYDNAVDYALFNTLTGGDSYLSCNNTNPATGAGGGINFLSNGFSFNTGMNEINGTTRNYVAYSLSKYPGFFDVVQWDANGDTNQTIPHSLGTAPGCIICRTEDTGHWYVYHSSLPGANGNYLQLNTNAAANGDVGQNLWQPTTTSFQAADYLSMNTQPQSYVGYLFAEDTANLIKCGGFTTSINTGQVVVDCGFQPQWLLMKKSNVSGDWQLIDSKRGDYQPPTVGKVLYVNTVNPEGDAYVEFVSNGFKHNISTSNTEEWIYVAIAAPPTATSLTTEEYAEQKLKFATYKNREMVVCGNEAQSQRDDLIAQLQFEGYTLAEIEAMIGPGE